MDVSLPAGARADVPQHLTVLVIRVGSVEAVPANLLVIVVVRHGDTESARGGECPAASWSELETLGRLERCPNDETALVC